MSDTVIDRASCQQTAPDRPALFVVWIDTCMGYESPPDWEMNSPPKPLPWALDEAQECREGGYPTLILPEGQTPRHDGLFTNPATEP
ncbi:hypothetical protein [Methylibium petroleiphilum]